MKALILAALAVGALYAQTAAVPQHSATLAWKDPGNPAGVTYNVKRATGLCSGTPAFNTIATAITTLSYTDTTVAPGNYCYEVSATFAGVESPASNTASASVPSFAPVNLSVTVQ